MPVVVAALVIGVSDRIDSLLVERLRGAGNEVGLFGDDDPSSIPDGAEVVVFRSTGIRRVELDRLVRLQLLVRVGSGLRER